jgi:hypothetical protein
MCTFSASKILLLLAGLVISSESSQARIVAESSYILYSVPNPLNIASISFMPNFLINQHIS